MTLEEAVRADMSKAIHDQLTDIVNKAVRKGYDLAKAELIRCKDCVFWKNYCRVVDGVRSDHVCSKKRELDGTMHRTKADDFCSWAERTEE